MQNEHVAVIGDPSKMTWKEMRDIFNQADGDACAQFDSEGALNRTNIESRVAFLEQEWVASQGIIGLLLAKLADTETANA